MVEEGVNSYQPIPNLPFLSKRIENMLARKIIHHIRINYLYDRYQSAYREDHSRERGLIKLHSYISDSPATGRSPVFGGNSSEKT